uniref:Cytochrome b5 heme-binding domain-containing protein n=1 Tax=Hemiselmis andersenii TaxID=464988 RepID=A0A6U4SX50_HEMAN|mmetsp:Transcript_15525/g.35765  ORF Transcript_15525/g.35765 Transcript_15525/m.35765 type:complete len:129 (+) Transcript_15525:104-490(+)
MGVFNEECLKEIEKLRKEKGNPKMSWADVKLRNKQSDCCIVIDNCVFDVTGYLSRHPGGQAAILRHAGKNATSGFDKVGSHTSGARKTLAKLYIADVGSSFVPTMGSKKDKGKGKGKESSSSCNCVLS